MRFGVFLPNFGPFGDPGALVELAVDAERAGWDGLFIWDHIQLDGAETGPIVDPWVALAAVASATTDLRFGTMITPLARRRPWKVARETVTLDRLSGGRLTIGVGLGYPPEDEFGTFGEETDDRIRAAKLDEGLEILDGLWSGRRVDHDGEHYRISGAEFLPRPVQDPRVPVWCAGWWPNKRPFRRAARWDGVAPELIGGATPTPENVAEIAEFVRENGAGEGFDIAVNGYSDAVTGPEVGALADYREAGVTWWLERIDTDRLYDFNETQQRVHAGPPGGGDDQTSPDEERNTMKHEHRRNRGSSVASRRGAVRWVGIFSLIALFGVVLAACGSSDSDSTSASSGGGSGSGETINLLTWQTYHEPAQLEEFEKETGITVKATNVGSPAEMFSKVKANPGQFDIVLNTAGWFPQYVESDLLEPIEESKVTSMKNIELGFDWEEATTVDGQLYGVLYNWGDQPLGWIPDRLKGVDLSKYENSEGVIDDWNVFWDPQLKGKVSIFDDPTSVEPMIALALGFENPYQLDDKEFEEFSQKLLELRPQVKRLTSGYDDQTAAMANGEADVAYLNVSSIAAFLKKDGIHMDVNNTVSQGVPAWSDNYAITKEGGANKLDAVYEFINKTLEVPWQAKFIADSAQSGVLTYDQATSPEAKEQGLTNAKLEETLIPATRDGDKFFSKMVFFQPVEDLQARLDLWNEFKLGLGS